MHKCFVLYLFYDIIQNVNIRKCLFCILFLGAVVACDLQPKIASIPDNVGMFIEDRYPALLADPEKQPEIYNSAVTDYGVYASPELYGSGNTNDYVLYASVDDYVLKPDDDSNASKNDTESDYLVVPMYGGGVVAEKTSDSSDEIIVVRGDTVYSLARSHNMTVSEFAQINNLKEPYTLSIGQKLTTRKTTQNMLNVTAKQTVSENKVAVEQVKPNNTKRVELQEITVVPGDTLYSLSRKYEIPVNDLAVMNKLNAPFTLSVGQKIKVPKLDGVAIRSASEIKTVKTETKKITPATKTVETKGAIAKQDTTKTNHTSKQDTNVAKTQKISSDPEKQLPKITSRSNSKFSWPVRGNILSGYGPKKGGLVNDGINIAASQGTPVKAAENGVVAYAGNEVKGMGNLIIIQHSDGWMTIYAHLDSMSVKRGTRVNVGNQIGTVGKTGKVDKPQLHFEIRKGTKAYNPTQYLKK